MPDSEAYVCHRRSMLKASGGATLQLDADVWGRSTVGCSQRRLHKRRGLPITDGGMGLSAQFDPTVHRCLARASSWPPRPRAEDNRPEPVTSDRRCGADGSCSWLLSCVHPSLLVDYIVVAYAAALKGGKTVRITECRPRSCLQGRFHRSISKLRPVDMHLLGRAIAGPGALAADDEYR